MKILILGNSITRHSPSPGIGWTGDWGMAASAKEKDFSHLLAGLLGKRGRNVELRARNVADFERDPSPEVSEYFADDIAFRPNAAVLRICENTPAEAAEAFAAAYEKLILLLKSDRRGLALPFTPAGRLLQGHRTIRARRRCGSSLRHRHGGHRRHHI